LTKLSGIGDQTANKIWRIAQQYHHLNAKTAKDMIKKKDNILYCSTGSQALDELLQGGIATKAITEFFGEAGMGKTQLCYTAAVYALLQKKEGGFMDYDPKSSQRPRVHWLDTEATFNPERIVEIIKSRFPNKNPDEFLDNIIVHQVISTDKMIDTLHQVFQSPDNIVLIILDSLIALFRFEYSHGVSELARRQQKLQQVLGLIKRNMMIKNCAFLFSNQATTKMTMAGPISITKIAASGGFAVAHAVTHRIKLTSKSAGKNKGMVLRKATVVDSPYIPAGEVEFVLTTQGVADVEKTSSRSRKAVKVAVEKEFETEDDVEDDILV
jgi:DNA repair protein RadA